jgi:hypothetical protein
MSSPSCPVRQGGPRRRNTEYQVNDQRGFSVLDQCDLDDDGNKHRAHAHIAICERLKATISREDDIFVGLQEWLKLLFEQNPPIWQRAVAI